MPFFVIVLKNNDILMTMFCEKTAPRQGLPLNKKNHQNHNALLGSGHLSERYQERIVVSLYLDYHGQFSKIVRGTSSMSRSPECQNCQGHLIRP